MWDNLLIVESPSKAKTITKYLNEIFKGQKNCVRASCGHIRDLGSKSLGIDTNDNFKLNFQISSGKI